MSEKPLLEEKQKKIRSLQFAYLFPTFPCSVDIACECSANQRSGIEISPGWPPTTQLTVNSDPKVALVLFKEFLFCVLLDVLSWFKIPKKVTFVS